ncbi:MAG: Bug family tripartite tricarboxylate transporter substrate binding protein [Alphaproteobacteria bacterium]
MKRIIRRAAPHLLGLAAAALFAVPASAQSAAEFYKGKTLNIVVGTSPGGGYDTYSRALARHLVPHVPGLSNIIVRNMPGAGSLTAVLHLDATAEKDGTVMTAFNSGLFNDSIGAGDKAKTKFTDYAFIGSITSDFRVCYSWGGKNIKTWDNFAQRKEIVFGATGINSNSYNGGAMIKNIFGLPVKIIHAYPGNAEVFLAVERGELDGSCLSWTSLPDDWITNKKIDVLVRLGTATRPGIPDGTPFIGDLAKTQQQKDVIDVLLASGELGRPYIMSKDVPADRVAAMRAGFMATMKDAAFLAEAKKLGLEVDPTDGATAQNVVAKLYTFPPETVAKAQEALK